MQLNRFEDSAQHEFISMHTIKSIHWVPSLQGSPEKKKAEPQPTVYAFGLLYYKGKTRKKQQPKCKLQQDVGMVLINLPSQ